MSVPSHVTVVGASAAGLATAEALRRQGYEGTLTLLGDESHEPYDRPPLSKQVLCGEWEPDRARLRRPEALSALDAEFAYGDAAVGLDVADRAVHTASGRVVRADAVVLATGVRPRRLPGQPEAAGVHLLRTLDDARALRDALARSARLVVVGDGVLGAEIAATARGGGTDVTLAGPQAAPMTDQLGPFIADRLAALHTANGVRVCPGSGAEGFTVGDGRVTGVRLPDGRELPADAVVVAVGAAPATDWLADSGVTLDDGVVCDAHCRAADGIYAVGDVARWTHAGLGTSVRLENRTNATDQARAVAARLLGGEEPYTPVPHFWTDQFDAKIQVHGVVPADAEVTVVEGDPAPAGDGGRRRFVAVARDGDGRATGVLGWNMPKQTRLRRQEVVDTFSGAPAPTR